MWVFNLSYLFWAARPNAERPKWVTLSSSSMLSIIHGHPPTRLKHEWLRGPAAEASRSCFQTLVGEAIASLRSQNGQTLIKFCSFLFSTFKIVVHSLRNWNSNCHRNTTLLPPWIPPPRQGNPAGEVHFWLLQAPHCTLVRACDNLHRTTTLQGAIHWPHLAINRKFVGCQLIKQQSAIHIATRLEFNDLWLYCREFICGWFQWQIYGFTTATSQ